MVPPFSFSYCLHLLIHVEILAGRVYCTNDQIKYGIIYCRYQKTLSLRPRTANYHHYIAFEFILSYQKRQRCNESLSTYSNPVYLYHLSFYDSF